MRFIASERGLYVKEKIEAIENQMEERRSFENKKCDKDKVMMKANFKNN